MPKPEKPDEKHDVSIAIEVIGSEHGNGGHAFKGTTRQVADLTKFQIAIPTIMAAEAKAPSKTFGSKVDIKIVTKIDGRESQSGSKTFKNVDLGYALDVADAYSLGCLALNRWQRGIVPTSAKSAAEKSRVAGAPAFEAVQILSPSFGETLPAGSVLAPNFIGTGPIFTRILAWDRSRSRYQPIPGVAEDVTEWSGLSGDVIIAAWNVAKEGDGYAAFDYAQGFQWQGENLVRVQGTHYAPRWVRIAK